MKQNMAISVSNASGGFYLREIASPCAQVNLIGRNSVQLSCVCVIQLFDIIQFKPDGRQ